MRLCLFFDAEVFFFYLFALAPDSIFVFVFADPDVAEVVFGLVDYDNDFAGLVIFINSWRDFPEALSAGLSFF